MRCCGDNRRRSSYDVRREFSTVVVSLVHSPMKKSLPRGISDTNVSRTPVPNRRKRVIRHVPFKIDLSADEADGYFEKAFLDSRPREISLKNLPGFAEYRAAFEAIEKFIT